MPTAESTEFLLFSLPDVAAVDRFYPAELVLDDLWPRVQKSRVSRAVVRAFWLAAIGDADAERQLKLAVADLEPAERHLIRRHAASALVTLATAGLAATLRAAAAEVTS